MSKASGVVGVVGERAGKFGPMYSIKLENDEAWYGTKSKKPQCSVGDTVEFNFHVNARGYPDADLESLTTIEAGPDDPIPSSVPGGDVATPTEGRKAFDRKQAVIVYQSSRKDAIQFLKLAMDAGVIDLPAKGTKADKFQALRIFQEELSADYWTTAMGVFATGEVEGDEG